MKTRAGNIPDQGTIRHGFFSARGGVSEGIYATLNCGLGSNDNSAHVHENRRRVAVDLGVTPDRLITAHQVHSPTAVIVDQPWPETARPQVDGIVTATPGIALGVLTADCAPVLFCDEEARIIGAAHAGWRGAFTGVLDDTIDKMETLGAKRQRIAACVGPAISRQIYEVGDEFRQRFIDEDAGNDVFFSLPEGATRVHFDLVAYARHRLIAAGVGSAEVMPHCTFLEEKRYFSFRRSQKHGYADYGRQISAIVIGSA